MIYRMQYLEQNLAIPFRFIWLDDLSSAEQKVSAWKRIDVRARKSIEEVLSSDECPALDFVIGAFNKRFGFNYERSYFLQKENAEALMHLGYFGYMQFMMGNLRLPKDSVGDSKQVWKYLFELFKEAKKWFLEWPESQLKQEQWLEPWTSYNFMHRMMPLVKKSIPGMSNEDENRLIEMYSLVKKEFAGIFRSMTSFDGNKITYLTHLKEVFLTMLFTGEDFTVDDLLIALGHDILEDTDITKEYIQLKFGDHVAFGIMQLTKQSVAEKINRLLEWLSRELSDSTEEIIGMEGEWLDDIIAEGSKEGILEYERYRKMKKLGKIEEIPDEIIKNWEEWYEAVKQLIRDDYFDKIETISDLNDEFVCFRADDSLALVLDNDTRQVSDLEKLYISTIVGAKSCDVLNNMATLYDSSSGKIKRKTDEAKKWLTLTRKHAPEYAPALEYWIKYWWGKASKRK